MLPLGHLAVGYLAYSAWRRALSGRPPTPREAAVLGVATQFPDLVDKPLAGIGVLPSGRSLAHSLVTAATLVVVLEEVAVRIDRRWVVAPFGVGTVSHSVADAARSILTGRIARSGGAHLFWPVTLPIPEYSLLWAPGVPTLADAFSARPESLVLVATAAVVLVWDLRGPISGVLRGFGGGDPPRPQ